MSESALNAALRQFEAAEANLVKAEDILSEIEALIPTGIAFGEDPIYETNCRNFLNLVTAFPKIDGWKPDITLMGLDEIAQNRFDALEIGEIEAQMYVERQISEPGRLLRDYRYRFNQKRRELIREALIKLIDQVDSVVRTLSNIVDAVEQGSDDADPFNDLDELSENIAQIETLLGSSIPKPPRWSDLHRHIHFGMLGDIKDIIQHDWPSVKAGLSKSLYGEHEPVPVDVDDLGALARTKPMGPVATKLKWENLTDDDFERLIFNLISSEKGYENPEWLMKTNAPDRGRDLSVQRVHNDNLAGTKRQRVIIQCKHWQSKSIAIGDVASLKEQMKLWEPPRIDVTVIATSGRFTSDAVAAIEGHNQSDRALHIEMWPDSHLEMLLANRPALIAEFRLR